MTTSSAFVPWMIPHETHSLFDNHANVTPFPRGSDAQFTHGRDMNNDDNMILLRPIVQEKQSIVATLPSLQDVMFFSEEEEDPASSPPPGSNSSCRSQSLSSWSSIDDDNNDNGRKNSISSLLNSPSMRSSSMLSSDSPSSLSSLSLSSSPPPLSSMMMLQQQQQQQQKHYRYNRQQQQSSSMKRGRPRQNSTTKQLEHQQQQPNKRIKRPAPVVTTNQEKKRSGNGNAVTKGLRHFSKLVSDKVAERGVTTYNQVADELATEIRDSRKQGYDQKNIRRRVYDALNVLMAMDIIAKDKKEIRWLGISHNLRQPIEQQQQQTNEHCISKNNNKKKIFIEKRERLIREIQQEEQRQHNLIRSKDQMRSIVCNKMEQYVRLRQLVQRNQQCSNSIDNNKMNVDNNNISLPFFIVGCNDPSYQVEVASDARQAIISCTNNGNSHNDYDLNSNDNIPIYEDARVLQSLGFHHMSRQDKLGFLPDSNWSQYLVHDSITVGS